MKIRDEIIECIKVQETYESEPLALTLFLFGLTALFMLLAAESLSGDIPSMGNDKSKLRRNKRSIDKTKCSDILPVLLGGDFINHYRLFKHTCEFIRWFANLDAPEDLYDNDGSPILWYDVSFLQSKWNEFITFE